jgi:Tol biopolymer transport system component
LLSSDTWKNIDTMPDWLPDGRILFLRYSRVNGETLPPDIYAIEPDGSGLTRLGTIHTTDPIAIYGLRTAGDKLVYNYLPAGESANRGIWVSNLDGSDAEMIAATDREQPVSGVEASADGRYVMMLTTPIRFESQQPEDSWVRVLDIDNGQVSLVDPDHHVVGAGWSPNGSALVYIVNNRETPDENGLYVTGAPGEAGHLLLAGDFNLPNLGRWQTLTWGANNAVLLSRSPQEGIVLVQLGNLN